MEDPPDYDSPMVALALGRRGAGKSVMLEGLAENYLYAGANVLDLYGSGDAENLAWLRSPWVAEEGYSALLIRGVNVDVDAPWPSKSWKDISLKDLEENRIVISPRPLYESKDEEYQASARIIDLLFSRVGWQKYICTIARESASLFYSRIKLRQSQLGSKAEGIYILREARHFGIALLLDTQKLTSVDVDIRSLADYLIMKAQGVDNLPREFWFLYGFFKPQWFRYMRPEEFALVTKKGAIGLGKNTMPVWHKRPRENILRALGISVTVNQRQDVPFEK
ncbi:MAG: hypothetical protein JRN68_05065 [Nitrososphaerota archaeon]|jgi:hypothetical protein|nr:hypothetical protein [Nitrososphaerota archaeon]